MLGKAATLLDKVCMSSGTAYSSEASLVMVLACYNWTAVTQEVS